MLSYLADIEYPEIHEIENTTSETPSDNEEIPADSDDTSVSAGDSLEQEADPLDEFKPPDELNQEQEPLDEFGQEYESFDSSEYDFNFETMSATDTEILMEILYTMKVNQYIAIFTLAVALVILIFRPLVKAFGS